MIPAAVDRQETEPMPEQALAVGDRVLYEVATRARGDFTVEATVVGFTPSRVVVQFSHWTDGRTVRRAARPYRVRRA
jgi:hypothetical protein